MLANAEAMKQFEYLEKSLVSFKETVNEQTAELRQPSNKIGGQEKSGLSDLIDGRQADEDEGQNKVVKGKKGKKTKDLYKEFENLQGAPMLYPDEVLVKNLSFPFL